MSLSENISTGEVFGQMCHIERMLATSSHDADAFLGVFDDTRWYHHRGLASQGVPTLIHGNGCASTTRHWHWPHVPWEIDMDTELLMRGKYTFRAGDQKLVVVKKPVEHLRHVVR